MAAYGWYACLNILRSLISFPVQARAYFHGAKYDQAEIAFAQLVEDWTRLKGPNSIHTADCVGWFSRVYQAQYRWEEAVRLREREVEVRKSWDEPLT